MIARRSLAWLGAGLGLAGVVVLFVIERRDFADPRAREHEHEHEHAPSRDVGVSSAAPEPRALATLGASDADARRTVDLGADFSSEAEAPSVERVEPVLLAGTVQTERGEPIAGAEVELRLYGDAGVRTERGASDAAGRYVVRGERAGPRVAVAARKPGFAPTHEALESYPPPDVLDHVLVLLPSASVRGRVLFDAFLERERFEVRLGMQLEAGTDDLAADGTFAFDDLPAGWAGLGVFYDDGVLVWVEPLELRVGERCEDARLDPLDLRGAFREWGTRLVRPDGEPFADQEFIVGWPTERDEAQGSRKARTDSQGEARAILPTRVARVWLEVPGFQDRWLDAAASECALHASPKLTIGVDPRAAEFAGAVRVELVFADADEPPSAVAPLRCSIDASGEAELTLDVAGRYQVRWVPRELGATALQWPEQVIEVRAEPSEQYVALTSTDAQLAALRAALER